MWAPLTFLGATTSIHQPTPPGLQLGPAGIMATARGRFRLPAAEARVTGPLGLATVRRPVAGHHDITVYPNFLEARRLTTPAALRFRPEDEHGLRRGPVGLGTAFESLREYVPDDDIRLVNWRATARLGAPVVNLFRVEQSRAVVILLDTGRAMGAIVNGATRLDAAVDAFTGVATAADRIGDRCGLIAYDHEVRRRTPFRSGGGTAAIAAAFDLQARPVVTDHGLAFAHLGQKRSIVVILTDLSDEEAGAELARAIPVLGRRHSVLVVSARDAALASAATTAPRTAEEARRVVAAAELVHRSAWTAGLLRRGGAIVVTAPPERLTVAAVAAYTRIKSEARG
jgi:uncharacterized protein (DUF58 family)